MPATHQSTLIDAPIEAVWERVKDFHDFSWSSNTITGVEKVGDLAGDQVGAKRVLNGAFHETLIEYSPREYLLRYSIDDGPPPVSKDEVNSYVGTLRLSTPETGGTHVDWSSAWESDSEAGVAFCQTIYLALLGELKASFARG